MPTLDKELQELVAELQPTPEERQRQQVSFLHPLLHTLRLGSCIVTSALSCGALQATHAPLLANDSSSS